VAEGDESQGIRDVYVLSSKLYLAFSLLGVGLFYVWGLPLLEAVLPESRGFGDDIFVLFLATAVGIIAMPSALLNDSMEQSLRPGVVGVLACAAMVGVMAIQGRADGLTLGAVGYALVTFFSFYQLYRVWVAWRALHFSLVGGFRVVVAPGLPAVVGSMLLLAAAELGLRAELHLAVPLTLSVLALAVFALALFRVGLSGPERTAAKSSVLRLTRRRRGGAQASFPEGVDGG
jgi:hypothetical protein